MGHGAPATADAPVKKSGGGGGHGTGAKAGAVAARASFAPGFDGLGGGKKRGSVDAGDGPTGIEGDGEVSGRDVVWEFGDGEDIVGVLSEEGVLKLATQGLDGSADGFQGIAEVLHGSLPSGAGETDLVKKTAHEAPFQGKGESGSVSVRG